jgi:hypothetical protein
MALEDVIARFCNGCNATHKTDVTREAAPALAVTPVTSVTPVFEHGEGAVRPGSLRWLRAQGCISAGPEEVQHLLRWLPRYSPARQEALTAYVRTWLEAAETEPAPHRRDNTGRRAANTALRQGRLLPKREKPTMLRPDKTGRKQQ